MRCLALLLLVFSTSLFAGPVYKCVDSEGQVSYSDSHVCPDSQGYAKTEPVLTVSIKQEATVADAGLIELNFNEIPLDSVFDMLADYAGIPLIVVAITDDPVVLRIKPTPWYQVFNELVEKHNLAYRKAYNSIYLYEKKGLGEAVVNHPDLLRWHQDSSAWKHVIEQDVALQASSQFANTSIIDRVPFVVKRVKQILGEPLNTNQAEYVDIKESFYAGGDGTVVVNKGIYSEYEKQELRKQNEQLREMNQRHWEQTQKEKTKITRCFTAYSYDGLTSSIRCR